MARIDLVIEQITFARGYTTWLLDHINAEDWFRRPAGGVSHIAWQIGHLAMAEYDLALKRVRGRQRQDTDLIAPEFITLFAPESPPVFDPARYPAQAEIRTVFDRVHEQVLRELPGLDDQVLDRPLSDPHPRAKTNYQSLLWCAQHDLVHAGQIGLLRRELGYSPLW